jgi:fatty-acyl-CoA synthase
MFGLMQDRPLMISSLIEHAARFHGRTEIVTRSIEGPVHRTNYAEICRRSKQVANALIRLGVSLGDRIATLAWNTHRHLELYYGVSGSGAILHTVNPRLFVDQITYIVNHADDKVLFFDISLAPLVARLAPSLTSIEAYVAMTDRQHMPEIDLPNLYCYEELIGAQSESYVWPEFDERTASSLCYTSGTTGNPKGVLYSHRSTMLHTLMACSADAFNVGAATCLLLIVPMFHANAWGMPYVAAAAGAKLVLPGQSMDGESICALIREEGVTVSQAVPTVWLMLFQYLDQHPEIDLRQTALKRVGIGGSAPPRSMLERFERDYGIETSQGWGMTETSPIGVISTLLPKHRGLPLEQVLDQKRKQGRGVWGVELRLVDDAGKEVPRDGKTSGHLLVRGPWIASGYFKGDGGAVLDEDGFFPTGDIGTLDEDGYLQLVDRAKDVIKSGGEWISSIDLENAAMAHAAVAEAAVIGLPHPTWQERPLLLVVKKPGAEASREEILEFLAGKVVKWWLPDDVVFVQELPRTATGKLSKLTLRQQFKDHMLPTAK